MLQALVPALVSALAGGAVAGVLVVGGVQTYQATAGAEDESGGSSSTVTYADE